MLNGTVQWLTLAAFYGAGLVVAARWWVFVIAEPAGGVEVPDGPGGVDAARAEVSRRTAAYQDRWGTSSAVLALYGHALEASPAGRRRPKWSG